MTSSILDFAKAQRGMMWLFVAKLGVDFAFSSLPNVLGPRLAIVYFAIYLLVNFGVAYFVFRLVDFWYGWVPASICSLLIFVPCIGSLTVLILNGNALDRLRKAGIKVGFMGATIEQLAHLESGSTSEVAKNPYPEP